MASKAIKKPMETEEDREIQTLAQSFVQLYCNRFENICEKGELVQIYRSSFHKHKEKFEEFLKKTDGLLITLDALKFPVLKNGKLVVHFLTPKEELKKGEMYYQIGRTTPGTLSLKFSKAVDESKSQPQVSQVESGDLYRAFTPGYFQELRDYARKHHHPYSDVLFRQCLVWDPDLDLLVPLSTERLEPRQNLLTKAKAHSVGSEQAHRIKVEIEVKEGRSSSLVEPGKTRANNHAQQGMKKKPKAGLIRTKGKNVTPHLPVEESASTAVAQEATEGEKKDSLTEFRQDMENRAVAECGSPNKTGGPELQQEISNECTQRKELETVSSCQFISVNHLPDKCELKSENVGGKAKEDCPSVDGANDQTKLKSLVSPCSSNNDRVMDVQSSVQDKPQSLEAENNETIPKYPAYPTTKDAVKTNFISSEEKNEGNNNLLPNNSYPTSRDAVKMSSSPAGNSCCPSAKEAVTLDHGAGKNTLLPNNSYPTSRDAVKPSLSTADNPSYPSAKDAVTLGFNAENNKSNGHELQNGNHTPPKDSETNSTCGNSPESQNQNPPRNFSYPTSRDAVHLAGSPVAQNGRSSSGNPAYPTTKDSLSAPN